MKYDDQAVAIKCAFSEPSDTNLPFPIVHREHLSRTGMHLIPVTAHVAFGIAVYTPRREILRDLINKRTRIMNNRVPRLNQILYSDHARLMHQRIS